MLNSDNNEKNSAAKHICGGFLASKIRRAINFSVDKYLAANSAIGGG